MTEEKQRILIVEDDLDIADMLNAYFSVQGYEVQRAERGETGLEACRAHLPGLVILDALLPDLDGYEVARRLRQNEATAGIPIIFLNDDGECPELYQVLNPGLDGFLAKPFRVQDLRTLVNRAFQQIRQNLLAHPVTHLPQGNPVDERLGTCLGRMDWVILLISLLNLERFRSAYGDLMADDALRVVGRMIRDTMLVSGGTQDFLGHLNATLFVLVTSPERYASLRENIGSRLEQSLEYFYPIKDRRQYARKGMSLGLRMDVLQPADGIFTTLQALKDALLNRSQETI